MTKQSDKPKSKEELESENERLRSLLEEERYQHQEAKETLEAIRTGAVDGIVRSSPEGEQVFILKGADQPYRNLIEEMSEGALLISESGTILYANIGFAGLVDAPLDKVIGTHVSDWVSARNVEVLNDIISENIKNGRKVFEIAFQTTKQKLIPTQISLSKILFGTVNASALVVTDLTKHMEEDIKRYTAKLEREITERKKAEEAVQQSELRYRQLFSSMTEMFQVIELLYDESGKAFDYYYRNVNPAFEKLVGKTREQLVDKRAKDLFGIVEDYWIEVYDKVAKTGKPAHFENYGAQLDKWYEIYAWKTNDKLVAITFTDVTERKRAEKALKESEERFSAAFHANAAAAIISRWSDGKYLDVNDAFLRMFEYTREEVIGHTSLELRMYLKEDDRSKLLPLIESDKASNFEMTFRAKSGRLVDSITSTKRVFLQGQAHIVTTMVDITERKKAEEALRQAEERFRIALKNAPVSVAAQDLNLRYIWAYNQKTAKPEQIIGHTDREIFNSEIADRIRPIKERVLREGLELREQMWVERPSGRIFLDITWLPLKDSLGKIVGVTSATVDLTELKLAQEVLKERTGRLEQTQMKLEEYANQMEELANDRAKKLQESERMAAIGQVAGMVGHDIRNPLQAIVGELYVARESMKQAPKEMVRKEALESVDFIEQQVDYINKIVADLQDFAKPLKPSFSEEDLCQFIDNSLKAVVIPDNIEAKIICDQNLPISLDKTFTTRVLTNLVTNAIQAMPQGGKLTLKASKQDNLAVIIVEDTGVGITNEAKPKMFTPMFTTKAKGQGFGLPVVKRLVEAQGGSISFESEVGKGTRFIVKLPQKK
jgi:PAS domain S-box-containing protein